MRKQLTDFNLKLAIILIILLPIIASAQTGNIKGVIYDKNTNDILPYTNVIVLGTSMGAAADADGEFSILNVPIGSYKLKASYIGYQPEEQEIKVVENKTIEIEFYLEAESSILGETVIVTAQAEGQRQAINEQINSIAIKSVVSAAKIQELPDANAAESVGRLPGVSVLRTGGEGSKVVVRGLSPQYNRVTIDGVELPSNATSNDPDQHGVENRSLSLSGDRATDLSMISSNMLGGIEVIKAITPDMDATVLGGVVNFSMRKARKSSYIKPAFEIITQGSYNGLKEEFKDYKFVGSYEQRFFDNKLGVFAQASAERRNLSSNELDANYTYAGSVNANADNDPDFMSMSLADVLRDRKRLGGTVVLDYTYSTGSIGFMNFYSNSKTNTSRRSESYTLLEDQMFYNGAYNENELNVLSNLLSVKQRLGDWGIDLKLSHSYSESKTLSDVNFSFWQQRAGFANKYTQLRYSPTQEIAANVERREDDAEIFELYDIRNNSQDRTLNASLDFYSEYTLSSYVTAKVKFGGSYQYRKRSYDFDQLSGSLKYDDGAAVANRMSETFSQFEPGETIMFEDFINGNDYSYGNFLDGDYTLGSPIDIDFMREVAEFARNNPATGSRGGFKYNTSSSLINDYHGNENRSAGYLMANFNIGQIFTIIPGGRYQSLTTTYSGIQAKPLDNNKIDYNEAEKTVTHGYFLPMIHFRIKPNDWFQFHFAYTNTLNYADYSTIVPKYYIAKSGYINYNNYDLKPARSENFDAVFSVFTNEIGLFSITGFKKNIKDLVFPARTVPHDWSQYPDLADEIDQSVAYRMNTYINSPIKIDLYGIETEWQTNFWYLPEPFNGIVLNINYTHVFSEAGYPRNITKTWFDNTGYHIAYIDTSYSTRMLNQPNDILNVTLGFDYKDFSLRTSLLYQDNIFKHPDFWPQNRITSDKYLRFDLSARQILPWYNIQVYMNINNITSEDDIDINGWNQYDTKRQKYGMSIDTGIRVQF